MTTNRRVALVTGASGGIGSAAARRLAADGLAVAVHFSGRSDRAQEVVDAITADGGEAIAVGADVADVDAVSAAFDTVDQQLGGIDVVVHTAGILALKPIAELDLSEGGEFDRLQRVNVRGTYVVAQQAARRVRDGGAVILFSTSVKKLALPSYGSYAGSKGAVDALVPVLAKELRGRDITVNAVAPGPTATPLFLDGKSQDTIDHMASMAPLERLGVPEDIAETVSHLAGPARWTNAQVLYVNGGIA